MGLLGMQPALTKCNSLELNPTLKEIYTAYKNVAKWAKPEYVSFSIVYGPMRPHIRKEPQGTVLIISPFNYPLFLTIGPLVCQFNTSRYVALLMIFSAGLSLRDVPLS
jgi:acyl-CoA reductase-like NAD-dependent aldehyde dehydrogenase